MAGFAERYIGAFQAGAKDGQQAKVDETIQKFGTLASQGDEQAMSQIYGVDPGAAAQLETQFANRNKSGAEWDNYVQEQAGRVAHSVLTAPAEQRAQRVASGIDFMTGLTRRDPRFKTVIDGWRQKLQAGDMPGIESELNAVLERTMGFKEKYAGGTSQPKSETERMWAIINGGDPSSPEYRMAYHELFGKEKIVVDPQSGMPIARTSPPPAGVTAPGGRPQAPMSAPQAGAAPGYAPAPRPATPPVSRPAAPAQMPPRPSAGSAPGYAETDPFPDPQLPPAEGPPVFQDGPQPRLPQVNLPQARALPMVDAFGRPIDPMASTAAERKAETKQMRASYDEQRKAAAKDADSAQKILVDAQNFQKYNEKLNRKGSGNIGTGGFMALPFADAIVGAVDSDVSSMNAIVNRLLPEQREPGSGSTSDKDMGVFRLGLFGADKPFQTNKIIADGFIQNAKDGLDYQRFLDLYYKQNNNADEAGSLWKEYLRANPIFAGEDANPTLNQNRQSWRDYFQQRGLIGNAAQAPTAAPEPKPASRPDAVPANRMQDMIKSNPGRFVPLD
jgi:hypothetical protein